ncbi:hypothetical protein UCMB321_3733 [Pseudomonas batumici]|uniref:Uncharacterized protein n=1 Tax=Pseudomonas batumici TaxID=226910 RepID=A0A0C2I6F5_9PSED|nr:hypothetical protein UCMB321_3733 [Pseudomonas batumici]
MGKNFLFAHVSRLPIGESKHHALGQLRASDCTGVLDKPLIRPRKILFKSMQILSFFGHYRVKFLGFSLQPGNE